MAPEFTASKSDTLMNGNHMSAPSKQLQQLQNFALSPDGSHANLPLDALFTQTNGPADFQSFTPVTDAGSGGMGYSQETRVADLSNCSFPDNMGNNTFPAPLQDVSQCTRSPLSQPDFLNHNSLAQSAGQIPSSHQTMSINAMSQMTENELLWVINPSAFEPCV